MHAIGDGPQYRCTVLSAHMHDETMAEVMFVPMGGGP
ncbi:Uncharacterised protein [Mycobacteroides abscessus subsp. abscessus]|nr:Uncharacterised protein [Mycobacteroides abscessus subsp. abscessus]